MTANLLGALGALAQERDDVPRSGLGDGLVDRPPAVELDADVSDAGPRGRRSESPGNGPRIMRRFTAT